MGINSAYLTIWYDQSGNNRNIVPYDNNNKPYLRLKSDMSGFPAVYVGGGSWMQATVGVTVTQFSAVVFMDLTERMTAQSIICLFGMGNDDGLAHSTLLKDYQSSSSLFYVDYNWGYPV